MSSKTSPNHRLLGPITILYSINSITNKTNEYKRKSDKTSFMSPLVAVNYLISHSTLRLDEPSALDAVAVTMATPPEKIRNQTAIHTFLRMIFMPYEISVWN